MQADTRTPKRCWACQRELATTDGPTLYLGERTSIRRPVTLWCACGGATYWRPKTCERVEVLTEVKI